MAICKQRFYFALNAPTSFLPLFLSISLILDLCIHFYIYTSKFVHELKMILFLLSLNFLDSLCLDSFFVWVTYAFKMLQ